MPGKNIQKRKTEITNKIKEDEIWKCRCELSSCERDDLRHKKIVNFQKCPQEGCSGFLNNKFICPNSHL